MEAWDEIAASAVPLTGGYGGETYAVSAAGERAVLRLYLRRPERAAVDVALLQLVRELLPVPRVLDAKPDGTPDDPPYVLTERLPGVTLETFLVTATIDRRRRIGHQLGELLVRLSGMPFLHHGEFQGGDLAIVPFGVGDLDSWYDARAQAIGFDATRDAKLRQVIDDAEGLGATGTGRACLVHSDFNPKNLLVDPDTATITGLVDWEFAHAGSPYADLGNLLRFCDDPVLGGTALGVVRGGVPGLGERLLDRVRAADLWALIELAGRAPENPVAVAAHTLLARIADRSDLAGGRIDLDVVH